MGIETKVTCDDNGCEGFKDVMERTTDAFLPDGWIKITIPEKTFQSYWLCSVTCARAILDERYGPEQEASDG